MGLLRTKSLAIVVGYTNISLLNSFKHACTLYTYLTNISPWRLCKFNGVFDNISFPRKMIKILCLPSLVVSDCIIFYGINFLGTIWLCLILIFHDIEKQPPPQVFVFMEKRSIKFWLFFFNILE